MLCLEVLLVLNIALYITNTNLLSLLYNGGLYLFFLGLLLLIHDMDIFIGFLWVIDLGVGLVFFLFILHYTSFLFQKSHFNLSERFIVIFIAFIPFLLMFLYFFPSQSNTTVTKDLCKTWNFRISYLDYYFSFNIVEVTELNLLRELYFVSNTFEFFLINFSLFFGIVTAILFYFMITKVFNFLNYSQVNNINFLGKIDSTFFLKNQNFITQQNTSGVVKVWSKIRCV